MKCNLFIENNIIQSIQFFPLNENIEVYDLEEDLCKLIQKNLGKIDVDFNLVKEIEEKEEAIKRINELRSWFDSYYTEKEQKYRRLDWFYHNGTINEETTKAHTNLVELYHSAEEHRAEINELEKKYDL